MNHLPRAGWLLVLAASAAGLRAEMVTRRWGSPPSALPARRAAPRAEPPTCYVAETKDPPKLDGKLDDPAWQKAHPVLLARTLDGSASAAQATEVRLLRDKASLYLAWRCSEPLMQKLKAAARGHDGDIWQDDSVECFIGQGNAYFHFGANAAGSTFDGRGKDPSWNSGFKAAAGRQADAWTLEMAIPLAQLGSGTEWIANFNRNRYAAGTWQESAWSPTFSGDSHVPARFGRMLFREPPAPIRLDDVKVAEDSVVTVTRGMGGLGIVEFAGFSLPRDTRVVRADLLVFRTAQVDGRMAESMADVVIVPRLPAGDPKGRPLELRAPAFDRFDATEAVRRCVAAGAKPAFLVQACPLWNPDSVCLDVAYEGEPGDVPPPAADVKAFHRAGQTFITWREVGPLIASEKTTWGEIKAKLAEAKNACRYRIYSSAKPIAAANLPEATLVDEVGPLSACNTNARNKEYLIGQAMLQPDEMGELARDYNGYMHTWTMDSPRMDRYPVARFAIEDDRPLPVGAGLYVHHPASPGRRYYAVVSVRDGVESTREVSSAGPVDETVGVGQPVRQGKGLWGPFFDYPGTRWVYVQWAAPPLAPRPNMAFNWSVLIPPRVEGKAPAELYFHPDGYSYAQPGKKLLLDSIQIAPHDCPPSGWYGFNEAWGSLKSFKACPVRNHTQMRLLAFLDWAKRALPIDPARILAVGSDGAAALALASPDTFACVLITGFDRNGVLEPKAADRFAAVWGPKSPDVKDARGRGEWAWANLDDLVDPAANLPLFVCRGASWGGDEGWGKGRGRFYRAMHAAGQPLVAHWAWGGQLQKPDWYTGLWRDLDIRRDTPIPAFANCSLDQEGEGSGNTNLSFTWKDIADAPDSFAITILSRECTFDLTPRRLQKFRVKPGEELRWEAETLPGRSEAAPAKQDGSVAADADGVVTLKGLSIPKDCPGIKLMLTRGK